MYAFSEIHDFLRLNQFYDIPKYDDANIFAVKSILPRKKCYICRKLILILFFIYRYKYDVDKMLTQIQFIGADDKPLGVLNWFAVHPTSMNNTNHLVSSDNMGYASILFEKMMNNNDAVGKVSLLLVDILLNVTCALLLFNIDND